MLLFSRRHPRHYREIFYETRNDGLIRTRPYKSVPLLALDDDGCR